MGRVEVGAASGSPGTEEGILWDLSPEELPGGKDKVVDQDLVLGWRSGAALPPGVAAVGDVSARRG